MDSVKTPAPPGPSAWGEDLADLAAFEFQTAQTGCVACHDYHSLWGYLRLTGITGNSFQADRDILEPLLHQHTPEGGRVLIAGAADAGGIMAGFGGEGQQHIGQGMLAHQAGVGHVHQQAVQESGAHVHFQGLVDAPEGKDQRHPVGHARQTAQGHQIHEQGDGQGQDDEPGFDRQQDASR